MEIKNKKIGVLLTNIGSPDQPTPSAVKRYLRQFLSDRRVVEIPRIFWWPILYGIILPIRSKKSAALYQSIWTNQGSPLTLFSIKLAEKLQIRLQLPVALGMHYGNPSIESALKKLRDQQVEKIIVLPLYPQYSATTTASTFDHLADALKTVRNIPAIQTLHDYACDENYIDAICQLIKQHTIKHLLFSFHGIPKQFIDKGDPYQQQCYATVELIAKKLQLTTDQYSIAFQSRLGRAKWLTPYTENMLIELPKRGITDIHVICPGFAVDCLETLEEISIRGKKEFLQAGGKSFQYISALNDSEEHVTVLQKLILNY